MKSSTLFVLAAVMTLMMATSQRAQAQVLIIVNDTNPGAVTFTSTGAAPSTNASGLEFFDGFDLEGFFGADASALFIDTALPLTLTTGNASTGTLFNGATWDNASTSGGAALDLNLYGDNGGGGNAMSFDTGSPAFNFGGTVTFDLTGFSLPTANSIGILAAGFSGETTNIGTYQVTPEPSTWAMMMAGLAVLGFYARRKSAWSKA